MNYDEKSKDEEMPYDLRQVYAIEIVGRSLLDVMSARKNGQFKAYFEALRDLKIVVSHKFKNKEIEKIIDGKKIKIPAQEYYDYILKIAVQKCNEFRSVFLGYSQDSRGVAALYTSLMNIEEFLYSMLDDELNMMGRTKGSPGL